MNRRKFLELAGTTGAALITGSGRMGPLLASSSGNEELARFPEKTELILLTDRPPQLETPLHYFRQDLTPNEAFFVRWHLEGIPTSVDLRTFRLNVSGHVRQPLQLSVDELRSQFEPISLIAVNQCSGNSRSFFEPRVPGGQWKHGAVGNAKWTGVSVKSILDRAQVKAGAVDVSFNGLDAPPLASVADFVKALAIDHARDGEVMIAYAMNDQALPMVNGFPLRLVVPGWYGTYWVKALSEITVLPAAFSNFWTDKAYRIPSGPNGTESPENMAKDTVPINRFNVRSLIVRPEPDESLRAGMPAEMEGIAFDAGYGIRRVEVSMDGGTTWTDARLDPELGKYSWRRWRADWKPTNRGSYRLMARATNAVSETQSKGQWNRSGFMWNVISQVDVKVE
ncbi:MAG TPA: molybdopterin-dependent oxidoreductase [Candidatus Sulfotelmatobacter sp.]|jgi:sulfite dehydrogenase|nr:molybdopterin-dependent oxidoreductase [Candidatus Sulfotelmatobacter sp.]